MCSHPGASGYPEYAEWLAEDDIAVRTASGGYFRIKGRRTGLFLTILLDNTDHSCNVAII